MAFPFLSPFLDAMVLKEVIPLSDPLAIYGAPQDQLSEQKKEFVEFVDGFITLTYDEACCHSFLKKDALDKG